VLKTLDRYVIREILPPALISLLIFTFVLEIPPVMAQLEQLVAKGVSWGIAGRMLLTLIPQALGLTIPMALLVGLLVGLGRMSSDREAVALLATGVSPYRLLRPVLLLALVAGAATLYVMLKAIPDANQTFRQLSYDVISKKVENDVHPQVFFDDFPGWVLFTRDIETHGGGWKDVLVADTRTPDQPTVFLAHEGRLVLDRAKRTVELRLKDGTKYGNTTISNGKPAVETFRFPGELVVSLDPNSVFPRVDLLQRGLAEMTIPELRSQMADKLAHHLPPHQEIIFIQQKFSFPAACVVLAIIGLALGLTVAREGKFAGFVVGVGVIFAYYILMYLADAVAKGYYSSAGAAGTLTIAEAARWVPNVVLLPVGILALIWRARWAEGRLPFRWAHRLSARAAAWWTARQAQASNAAPESHAGAPGRRGDRVIVVIRIPSPSWMLPNILDRYISRLYARTAGISFLALLGLFYISTFIDRSDKMFKGQASASQVATLLAYMTPQFVYYVIPLAALLSVLVTFGILSRTSEISVMKACGISVYRMSAPLLAISLAWSLALFGLEQRIMARANQRAEAADAVIRGRPPRTSNPLDRRWLVGRDGDIYHYSYFDPRTRALDRLIVYRPAKGQWALESETYTPRARFTGGTWQAQNGWRQGFTPRDTRWEAFSARALPLEPPDYFEAEEPLADMMTVPQLKKYIDDLHATGIDVVPLSVELQRKLAFPFVTVVMTLLAIPFAMTTGKRGTLYGIGIGIVLALSYWIVGGAFTAIGKAGLLAPALAGWAPNIIAAGSAGYLLLTTKT
jgi:LPS export ABC transporter permease LptG/LPS export ABC transporter permease LptF